MPAFVWGGVPPKGDTTATTGAGNASADAELAALFSAGVASSRSGSGKRERGEVVNEYDL